MTRPLPFVILSLLLAPLSFAEIKVTAERNQKDAATADFKFQNVPALSDTDAAQEATIEVIDGKADWGCDPKQLIDGGGPANAEDAWRCFRFGQNTNGGRIRMDLGAARPVSQVNTYSWNAGARAPQVYTLYGAAGAAANFSPTPRKGADPAAVGWTRIAAVDTRPPGFLIKDGGGGQYGVSIADDKGAALGRYRYLLWDIAATSRESWASTFYAEFDVVAADAPTPSRLATIKLKSGRSIEGAAHFDSDALLIKQGDGERRIGLEEIALATFRAPPPAPQQVEEPSAGGLKAEYFDDQELQQKPRLVRYDPAINFQWGLAAPDPSVNVDFSARWTGRIEPKYSETYTFHTHADDGVRLWIDGRVVIDHWNDSPPYQQQGTIALEGGRKYDIRIEYHDKMAEASMQLAWSSPSQPRQIVPASRLSPPVNDPAAPPRVALTAPAADRWRIAPGSLDLEAMVSATGGLRATGGLPAGATATSEIDTRGQAARGTTTNPAVARVEFFSGNTLLGTATTPPYKFTWIHVPPGHHRLTARATDEAGTITASAPVTVNVAANGSGSLPAPWGSMRLGPTERSDSSAYSGGMFTLRAGGGELRGAFDSGYFVAQPLDGDGQITVRVGDVTADGAPNAVAGVMIRESLSGDARYTALLAGKEGTEYLRRWEPASWVSASDITRASPCYLRLNRTGKSFKAYVSDNGSSWQLVGTDQLTMSAQAFVGLIATSRSDDAMSTATLDHVQVTAGSPPMDAPGAGVRTRGGTFLAGEVRKIDPAAGVELVRARGRNFTFAAGEVARVYLKPVPEELAAGIPRGRAGVLLAAGDFYEGEFKGFKEGRPTVDSVLFGPRSFEPNDVLAIVLHDVKEPGHEPTLALTTADGSTFVARSVKIAGGRVIVRDEAAGEFSASIRDIDRIESR